MGSRRRGIRGKGRSNRSSDSNEIRVADISCGFGWNFMILDELDIKYSIKYVYHHNKQMLNMFKSRYGKKRILDFDKDNRNLPKVDLLFYSLDKYNSENTDEFEENLIQLISVKKPKVLIMEETGSKTTTLNKFCKDLTSIGYKNVNLTLSGEEIGFPNYEKREYIISSLDSEYIHSIEERNDVQLQDLLNEIDVGDYIIDMFQRKTLKKSKKKYIYGTVEDGKVHPVNIYYSDRKILKVPIINRNKSSLLILDKRINSIRRVTSKELFRIMGYSDDCYYDFLNFTKEGKVPRIINQLSIYPVKKNVIINVLKMID